MTATAQPETVPVPTPPKEGRKTLSRPSRLSKVSLTPGSAETARGSETQSSVDVDVQPQPPATARPSTDLQSPFEPGTPGENNADAESDNDGEPVYPMSNWEALKQYEHQLSPYEHQEIQDFPIVHYFGIPTSKIHATLENPVNNHGFDDDKANYRINHGDHLLYRYEILGKLGQGAFGSVMKVRDHLEKKDLAVKIIRNKKRFAHQALMEIRLLQFLKDRDPERKAHIIHVGANFMFRKHLCICFELLSLTLYDLTRNNGFRGFGLELTRRFTVQMLIALRMMKSYNIVHCDLKPENILLVDPTRSNLRIIDFGSACFKEDITYTYIQSRFYRAPEVILGLPYDPAIDIWSLGCIVAEMVIGLPIFPGENEVDQMACITEVIGSAPQSMVDLSKRRKMFFDQFGNPRMKKSKMGPASKTMAQACDDDDPQFIEFMKGCLEWDPMIRYTANAAINSSWVVDGVQGRPLIQRESSEAPVNATALAPQSFLPPI